MKEKLEPKHVIPYLLHKIGFMKLNSKGQCIDYFKNFDIETLATYINHLDEIKPILRPLSDLTKIIKVKGEKRFKPITRFAELDYLAHEEFTGYLTPLNDLNSLVRKLPYWFVSEYLIKWHFDVFGLIEKGLAIDINTID